MDIPTFLRERIDEVIGWIGKTTNDWLLVKRQLINSFPPDERTRFSARHDCTKKHTLNDFDLAVIRYWNEQTGIELEIGAEKLHSPEWEHKKKGWALTLLNQERRRRRESERTRKQTP